MRSLNFLNLSNLYTKTSANKIPTDFKRILEQSRGGICGIEMAFNRGATNFTLVSPSFLRQDKITLSSNKGHLSEDSTFFEGYLSQPFFLPLCTIMDGEFIDRVQSLSFILKDGESVFIQWLFKKAFDWQDKAIEMYSSYILGNNYPITINAARRFQEKVLNFSRKFGASIETRDYIEEAEQKIIGEGYCFKLSVVINSPDGNQADIKNKIENIFNQYTSFNSIKLSKVKGKNLLQHINNCIMSPEYKYQILSKHEILSLFGGNDGILYFKEIEDDSDKNNENEYVNVKDAIELLPNYPLKDVIQEESGGGILQEIAEALKRVGIMGKAMVYNGTVTTGIRLIVAQFSIPKDKVLTDLIKKQKDIQAVLGVESLCIEQGDEANTVKISIPNEQPTMVGLRNLLEQESFKDYCKKHPLSFVAGVDEINNPIYLSMVNLVHLLLSGTTGSGKSIMLSNIINQLVMLNSPEDLKLVLIDPKQVEFQHFGKYPHTEVITDMTKATSILDKLTDEMDSRYSTFLDVGVKRIDLYNQKILDSKSKTKAAKMPYLVVIIDEYADLQMTHSQVEDYIVRLGQKARSAGIHIILATQRPSSDIISGKIKANILNAISFALGNSTHYKTVFGTGIPYNLLGRGDGCMKIQGWHKEFQRFQSPIISPDESEEEQIYTRLADFLNKKYKMKADIDAKEVQEEDVDMSDENEDLYRLKKLIVETKDCRTTELRRVMGIKNTKLKELMTQLADEGFLELKSRSEGYQINEDKMNEWIDENSTAL